MAIRYKSGKKRPEKNFDSGEEPLPPSVQAYLGSTVLEGGRNRALFDAAQQFRDIGEPIEEAFNLLGSKAMQDGLPEGEVRNTLDSVYRHPPREAPRSKNGSKSHSGGGRRMRNYTLGKKPATVGGESVKTLEGATPMTVPEPIEEDGFEKFILAAFEEGEGVCISRGREHDDGSITPDVGVSLKREDWLERVRRKGDVTKVEGTKLGLFVRMNPMVPVSERKSGEEARNLNEDVTDLRHVLVEFDTDSEGNTIPKDKQFGMMVASDLPITAVIDSGNKSLHAWVRVDAANREEYKERAETVYALFPDVDEVNHNPNRLSRAPDGFRTVNKQVVRQRLLGLNLGAETFEAWEALNEAKLHGERKGVLELLEYDVPNDPNSVLGNRWLCRKGSLVIVAPSGVGKSALTTQLATGWGSGRYDLTFGIESKKPLKQMILQAENDEGDLAEGLQGVVHGAELTRGEIESLNENLFYQTVTTLTGESFLAAVEGFVLRERPDICWIDPLLNFIGDDASKQEVIAKFCVEGLNAIASRTGTIWALIHHTAKPKPAQDRKGQTATDLAYSGFGSSGLVNWAREVMVLERWEIDDETPTFRLTATKRRTRAGMCEIAPEGEGGTGRSTDHIFIKHDVGRIRWVQCAKPENEEEDRPKRGARKGEVRNPRGRTSSLTDAQRLDIAEAVAANGGDPLIGTEAIDKLARKLGKHSSTIRRYLNDASEKITKARTEMEEEGTLST